MRIALLDLKAQYNMIRAEISESVNRVLESGQYILGQEVQEFEKQIAKYCGTRCAVACASGSDALLLSLMALGIQSGDEVITTPYTFFATAGCISRLGAVPVFADIVKETYNIDPQQIEEKITRKTRAILPVHLFGQCADMEPILEIASKHQLTVVEDAAQAIGSMYKKKKAGSMGTLGCFSFFPTKNLAGIGDGGMVVTNDDSLADRIRILREHGANPKYYHEVVGINSRLDALQAAVLKVKLKHLDTWNAARRRNAALYNKLLAGSPVMTPYVAKDNFATFNQYVVRAPRRDALQAYLLSKSISTGIYYPLPLSLQECFSSLNYARGDFPEAESAANETLAIPVYPELKPEEIEFVAKEILAFYA